MPDEERIEQLELEVKVLRANNKGLKDKIDEQSKEIEELNKDLKKKPIFLIKDIYSPKLKEISLQDVEGLIEQGREEVKDKIKAKIEEINKEMLNEENSLELFYRKKYCKEVLQSLLEKE